MEKILPILEKYNYKFTNSENKIFVDLGLSLEMKIEFTENGKIIISDKLLSWNFLTGMIQMKLKTSIIYNFINFIVLVNIIIFTNIHKELTILPFIIILLTQLSIFWTLYYTIKAEHFKRFIIDVIER